MGEFAATVEFCPSLLLLTVGEPLLTRAAIELGPFLHLISLGGTLTICPGASGETQYPDVFPLSGGSISWLLAGAQLLLPSSEHHMGEVTARGKHKTAPSLHLLSPFGATQPGCFLPLL